MKNVVRLYKEVGAIFLTLRSCHLLTDKHYPFSMKISMENTKETNTICFQWNTPWTRQSLCFWYGFGLKISNIDIQENTTKIKSLQRNPSPTQQSMCFWFEFCILLVSHIHHVLPLIASQGLKFSLSNCFGDILFQFLFCGVTFVFWYILIHFWRYFFLSFSLVWP